MCDVNDNVMVKGLSVNSNIFIILTSYSTAYEMIMLSISVFIKSGYRE